MINALRGRSYNFSTGISDLSQDWYVVGKILVPIRKDYVLGWRDPVANIEFPDFIPCEAYICVPAVYTSSWVPSGTLCSLVPLFAIEESYSTGFDRTPIIVTGKQIGRAHV